MNKERWERSPTQWVVDALNYLARNRRVQFISLSAIARIVEAWMKENAPWQDQTGAARASLRAYVKGKRIVLEHGVPYGYYLEMANQGQYSILFPAVDHFTPIYGDIFDINLEPPVGVPTRVFRIR